MLYQHILVQIFLFFQFFFMIKFMNEFKIISFKNFILIILNLPLSVPAFYYIFILDINFINKSAAIGLDKGDNILFVNVFNTILLTISIIFFYLIPFIITKIIYCHKYLDYKKIFNFNYYLVNFNIKI